MDCSLNRVIRGDFTEDPREVKLVPAARLPGGELSGQMAEQV